MFILGKMSRTVPFDRADMLWKHSAYNYAFFRSKEYLVSIYKMLCQNLWPWYVVILQLMSGCSFALVNGCSHCDACTLKSSSSNAECAVFCNTETCETEVCFRARSTQCTGQVKTIMEKYVLYWNIKVMLRYKCRGRNKISKVTQNSVWLLGLGLVGLTGFYWFSKRVICM